MAERAVDDIQRDIEKARVTLAETVDQIAFRTNPKRVAENVEHTLKAKAQTPKGKAVIGGAGVVVVILLIRRLRKRGT